MKQARAPYPQDGNNLWRVVHPPQERWFQLGSPGRLQRLLGAFPQHRRHLGRCGSSSPSRGRARGGPTGKLGKCAGVFSRRVDELATEGARVKRIGVSSSHPRDPDGSTSWLVACAAKADLALTRGSSAGVTTAREGRAAVDGVRRGLNLPGHTRQPGSRSSEAVLVDRIWSQTRRSGLWKRAAFDEAASGDGPGTSSLGGESNPVNPIAGSATEGVRGRVTTLVI